LKPKIDHLEALEESLMKEAESAFKTRDGFSKPLWHQCSEKDAIIRTVLL
jgi:hypothetical protein